MSINVLTKNKQEKVLYRLLEMFPGGIAWFTLILCILLSFFFPVWIAIFVICFDLYWLLRVTNLTIHLVSTFRQMKKTEKTNWLEECKKLKPLERWQRKEITEIYHLIIFPVYEEKYDIIKNSLECLINSNYPEDKMIVVLATERRVGNYAQEIAERVTKEFKDQFFRFYTTMHPDDIIGEIAGKGSNIAWAAKRVREEIIDKEKIPYENIIVSVFDIDTCVHKEYFGCLTYNFIIKKDPLHTSYQPIPVYHNNVWDAPALMRVVATSTSFWQMMEQGRPERLVTFSSHSMPFKALVDIGFWETNVVSEDSRIFWQCFIYYNGNYSVTPLFLPVSMDACLANTYWRSLMNQYKQVRRWAWGAENLPYVFFRFYKNKKISFIKKITQSFRLTEGLYSWAVSSIIIAFVGWLPLILGGRQFESTVLAQNLPGITQILMTCAMFGLLIATIVNTMMLPPKPNNYKRHKSFLMILQWMLLPIVTLLYGSMPALDAQTRLMFGKYMGYWVTEKERRSYKS